ncbi:YxD-tail cyclophane-containing RiPP peptide [Streptomyces sp. MST-110588]|uniref:YxD-tail cyclophane-containing RiPP peptide n=1 Tax=Streptomyces sp. MST-110588 TaxID=2833628 RepID=UPI001F5CC4F1|nr:YxD-tail cyclophane-containing RiPP peptide [Streptomyces sp. MST-110588]UNO39963.1 hypothetical protein KGS77_10615 [Streptomyces sp. MST-110588]
MVTIALTGPAPVRPPGPSAEPLPDFGGVDVASVAEHSGHPVLGAVAALLLSNWPAADEAVAYYEDGPGDPGEVFDPGKLPVTS